MKTFEVGKIYQSRDNEHRRILVVGRTPCFIKVQFITDGNHAIDETQRLKIRPALGNSGEMIFDTTDTYYAALEVIERPVVADISMAAKNDTADFTAKNMVSDDLVKSKDKLAVMEENQPKLESGDPVQNDRVKIKFNIAKVIYVADDPPHTAVVIDPPEKLKGKDHLLKLELINGFETAFKDNYRNENPERLHPRWSDQITYEEAVNHVWARKVIELIGLRTLVDVYCAIRSEGYVINHTTLTVECKCFKPCDIKVGGR